MQTPARVEVVRQPVGAEADVTLADGQDVTPLAHAEQQDCAEIVETLRDAGAPR